jgi:hypothetical protein
MAHISGQPVDLPIAVTPWLFREPRSPITVTIGTTVTFTAGTLTAGTITIGAP